MILERGNMFDMWGKTGLFLFTSNPIVNQKGLAVMGRGIAKQLADKYPDIQKDFGKWLQVPRERSVYPCEVIGTYDRQTVGYFMVKDHWKSAARLDIILESVRDMIDSNMVNQFQRIDLNFPGIGNGKLNKADVLPIITLLPDNVHVWEYSEQ